ncbi:MAG: Glucokinase, partial [uncultured Acidimicrobiales bacterium]
CARRPTSGWSPRQCRRGGGAAHRHGGLPAADPRRSYRAHRGSGTASAGSRPAWGTVRRWRGCSRSTSAGPSWRQVSPTSRARSSGGPRWRPRRVPTPVRRPSSRRCAGWSTRCGTVARSPAGWGAGARCPLAARRCRRSTSPAGARSPSASAWPGPPASRPRWTTTPRRSPSRRAGWGQPRAAATSSPWSCRRGWGAASCSTGACSTVVPATPVTSATSTSCRTATRARAGLGAASRPRRRAPASGPSPAGPPPRRVPRWCATSGPSWAGGCRRCATCSTCAWRWWPARLRSATAGRSSRRPRPSWRRAASSTSPSGPASSRRGWATRAPSSVRRRWRGGPSGTTSAWP